MEELSGFPSMRTLSLGDFRTDVYKHHGTEYQDEDEDQSWLGFAFNIASGFRALLGTTNDDDNHNDGKSHNTFETKGYPHRRRKRYPHRYIRNQLNDIPERMIPHSSSVPKKKKKQEIE